MKNIIIYAPVRSGRTLLAKKIQEALGSRIGAILIVDELFAPEKLKLDENFLMFGMGFAEISAVEEHKARPNDDTLERVKRYCDESKLVKTTSKKLGIKYFDVSFTREDKFDVQIITIVDYIRANL